MKINASMPIAIVSCMLSIILCTKAGIREDSERQIAVLKEMTVIIEKSGLDSFLKTSDERGWTAPVIRSAWFIAKMPDDPDGRKQLEQARSDLGYKMACQLTLLAKEIRETKDFATLDTHAQLLARVIEWLSAGIGYGNMMLQARADDIAMVAAIKLVADTQYPMERVEKLKSRLSLDWASPERIRQVLFEESGRAHFTSTHASVSLDDISKEFRRNYVLPDKLKSSPERADLEIFIDDNFPDNATSFDLERTWNKRRHLVLAVGGCTGIYNRPGFNELFEFRKRYGDFPLKPKLWKKAEWESDIQAAFRERIGSDELKGVGGAWITFEFYIKGKTMDYVFKYNESKRKRREVANQSDENPPPAPNPPSSEPPPPAPPPPSE